jgi:hypothetical protein
MRGFQEDWLEYKGWDKEFYALDLSQTEQALYAIRKWLTEERDLNWSSVGTFQIREACRYCTTKGLGWANLWLPGIDGDAEFKQHSVDNWQREMQKFYLLLWTELFPESPYTPADLGQYRQRIDQNFVQFPHMPEKWEQPEYKPW